MKSGAGPETEFENGKISESLTAAENLQEIGTRWSDGIRSESSRNSIARCPAGVPVEKISKISLVGKLTYGRSW